MTGDLVGQPMPWMRDPDRRPACIGTPTSLWFPGAARPSQHSRAKAICATCPVLEECREHGLSHERFGIWGGLTAAERRKIRRVEGISLVEQVDDEVDIEATPGPFIDYGDDYEAEDSFVDD